MKSPFPALCLAFALTVAAPAADPPKDRWIEKSETDKVTDSRKVYMTLMADGQHLVLGNWINKNWPQLAVGCEDRRNFFVVGINTPPKTGPGGKVAVVSRFGNARPVSEDWESIAGGTFLKMIANPINAAVALTVMDKFLIRYQPREGAPVTLEFTLVGAKEHLPKIAQACGWNYAQALRELR